MKSILSGRFSGITLAVYHLPPHNTTLLLTLGDLRLLSTVTTAITSMSDNQLSVNYREKYYATSKIPNGFAKRETFNTHEMLVSRWIDKSLRPLLADSQEVQVTCTLLSHDRNFNAKYLSTWLSSIAIAYAGVKIQGPIGSVSINAADHKTKISLSCTPQGVIACDLQSTGINTEALQNLFAHSVPLGQLKEMWSLSKQIVSFFQPQLPSNDTITSVISNPSSTATDHQLCKSIFHEIISAKQQTREDNRAFDEIRPISLTTGILPRSKGSAMFTRGATTVMASVVSTIHERDILCEESATFFKKRKFYLQYNFAGYCSGEQYKNKRARREIGHSKLASNAIKGTINVQQATRLSAETLSADGSSSMATVCAASLALYNGGYTSDLVAGISIGLFGDKFVTDLTAFEDSVSLMDCKVAGTRNGITAVQLDSKSIIPMSQFFAGLEYGYARAIKVLDKMECELNKS